MMHLLAHQGCRDVVLGVACGEEHEGDGGDPTRPAFGQTVHTLGDRGLRELYKAALDRERRVTPSYQRDQLMKLAGSPEISTPVPEDEKRRVRTVSTADSVRRADRITHVNPPRGI